MTDTKSWVPDWAVDMAKVPFDPNAERAAANFSTGGPRGMIPRATTATPSAPPQGNRSGWQAERPLQPQPGIDLIDRMVTAADQRERQQAQRPDIMQAAMMMLQIQSQQIAALAALVLKEDKAKAKAKPKPKQR
jgi:hypothetical protein